MKKVIYTLAIVPLLVNAAYAQRNIGQATSNYNTLNSMYINPATLGGCNEKVAVNLFSAGVSIDNNLGTIKKLSDINTSLNNDDSISNSSFINYKGKNSFSMMVPGVDFRTLGAIYRINANHTIGISSRVRVYNQFNNFDYTLYNTITNTNSVNNPSVAITSANFNWTANLWSEIGFSYGGVFINNRFLRLRAGGTLKLLSGLGFIGLKGNNMDIRYKQGNDTLFATNTDLVFSSTSIDNNTDLTGNVGFGGAGLGRGVGFDLGVSASLLPDKEDDQDRLTVGLAVTDIGVINYNKNLNVIVRGNGYFTGQGLANNVKNYTDFKRYAAQQGFFVDSSTSSQKVYLPTTLNITADYRFRKHMFVNLFLQTNLAKKSEFGSSFYSLIAITPRYDRKFFTASLPISYSMLSNNLRMGMSFRIYCVYFGSDDMMALFSDNQYGFNAYAGAMVPIYRKNKK